MPRDQDVALTVTAPGFAPVLWLARGAECGSGALQAQGDATAHAADLHFKAMGGRYLILVRGAAADSRGAYVLGIATPALPATETAATAEAPAAAPEDPRVALMHRQDTQRRQQIAADQARAAAAERARRQQVAAAAEAERQRQAERSQHHGMLGGLLAAAGGAAGIAALGGNADAMLDAATQMSAAVGSTDVSNALAASRGALGGGTTGVGGGAGGGQASYPTRPNALDGSSACADFTLSNYRTLGLSGGPDTQLKTLCAAAFAYYSAYLNAIRQGYSEADANRTFAAHQQAARVAIDFLESTR